MSSSSWSSPPPRRSTSSSAKTSSACSSVSRSALRGPRDRLLGQPGRPPERPGHLLLRHARLEQRDRAVHLAQPPDDREHEPAGALAVRLELLGERERRAQVARHERVGEVVGLRGGVARGQLAPRPPLRRSPTGAGRSRASRARARAAAGSGPPATRAPWPPRGSSWSPSSRAALHRPLGQLPGLRRGAVAHLAAGLLDRVAQRLERLAAHDQDEHGVRAAGRPARPRAAPSSPAFQAPASSTSR